MIGKRFKILIVDDSEINRAILKEILRADYDILEAEGGQDAIELLEKQSKDIALVMLDVLMPGVDGYDVLEFMGNNNILVDVPVIMLSTENSPDFMVKAFDMGAVDYVSRPFEPTIVQRRVKNTITLFAKKRTLVDIVAGQIYEKEKNNRLVASILSNIVEFRNGESDSHIIHVNLITELLLRQLMKSASKYRLTMSEVRLISVASSLHDIGKIAIPSEILNKPGKLTPEEFDIVKTHSEIGASMINSLKAFADEPLIKTAYEICRWHHERYDGKGYPDGLSGNDIPISAQAVAIADVYDVLTSERCYKKAYSHEKAIKMICDGECGSFNPLLLQCLLDISDKLKICIRNNVLLVDGKRELQNLTEEIIYSNDNAELSHTLQQLEIERSKAEFLESELSGIFFSFQSNPPLLTISESGAKLFGISRTIQDPLSNEEINPIKNGSFKRLHKAIMSATADNPTVDISGQLTKYGKRIKYNLRCQTLWSSTDKAARTGVVGIITRS